VIHINILFFFDTTSKPGDKNPVSIFVGISDETLQITSDGGRDKMVTNHGSRVTKDKMKITLPN